MLNVEDTSDEGMIEMSELLAPAGSWESLKAAVAAGANAVYLGGKMFGARQYASNFDNEELIAAVRYAHIYGVQIYVTVNTLVDDSEIPLLIEYLYKLYDAGVDAIIVQDIGVAQIASHVIPKMPLHASTQMTVHNLAGVLFLAENGFSRVVLARELSLADIQYICKHSPVEIETFIHGALCISYSGQCLMSSMIGGRSGNRGRCAQPCRLPYHLVNSQDEDALKKADVGEYLLSPKDLNTIDHIADLIAAGVASFKIEGRMKRPEYVSVVVDTYRRAIDSVQNNKSSIVSAQDHYDLTQIFNRGFTDAYLFGKRGRDMMSDRRPNNRGVQIGRVVAYNAKEKTAVVKLDHGINTGDVIEFWVKVGGRVNVTLDNILVHGKQVQQAAAGELATISVPAYVTANDRIFKTFDAALTERAREFFAGTTSAKKLPVTVKVEVAEGQPLCITITDEEGFSGEGKTNFLAEPAQKHPLTPEIITKQVNRMGTSNFEIKDIAFTVSGIVMVPVSEINEARRQAVENLERARLQANQRPSYEVKGCYNILPFKTENMMRERKPELTVNVDTPEKVQAAIENGADIVMFGGERFDGSPNNKDTFEKIVTLTREAKKKIILSTPRIAKEWQIAEVVKELKLFNDLEPDAISVGNVGTAYLAAQHCSLPLHADYPLNIFNSAAVEFWSIRGIKSITLSPELNFGQIEQLRGRIDLPMECLVHGKLTLMVSEYCIIGSYMGNVQKGTCRQICKQGGYMLKDRKNELFPVFSDQFCRMHVLNTKELHMVPYVQRFADLAINRVRIEGKYLTTKEIAYTTRLYKQIIDKKETQIHLADKELDNITRGHYFRGVM